MKNKLIKKLDILKLELINSDSKSSVQKVITKLIQMDQPNCYLKTKNIINRDLAINNYLKTHLITNYDDHNWFGVSYDKNGYIKLNSMIQRITITESIVMMDT